LANEDALKAIKGTGGANLQGLKGADLNLALNYLAVSAQVSARKEAHQNAGEGFQRLKIYYEQQGDAERAAQFETLAVQQFVQKVVEEGIKSGKTIDEIIADVRGQQENGRWQGGDLLASIGVKDASIIDSTVSAGQEIRAALHSERGEHVDAINNLNNRINTLTKAGITAEKDSKGKYAIAVGIYQTVATNAIDALTKAEKAVYNSLQAQSVAYVASKYSAIADALSKSTVTEIKKAAIYFIFL